MGLFEHCFHLLRKKAEVTLQLGVIRGTLTSLVVLVNSVIARSLQLKNRLREIKYKRLNNLH